jgi:hypothetical protein
LPGNNWRNKNHEPNNSSAVPGTISMRHDDKTGMTPESKAKDRYECEQQTYQAANGNMGLLSNGLYRDCMRARGYK